MVPSHHFVDRWSTCQGLALEEKRYDPSRQHYVVKVGFHIPSGMVTKGRKKAQERLQVNSLDAHSGQYVSGSPRWGQSSAPPVYDPQKDQHEHFSFRHSLRQHLDRRTIDKIIISSSRHETPSTNHPDRTEDGGVNVPSVSAQRWIPIIRKIQKTIEALQCSSLMRLWTPVLLHDRCS